MIAPHVRFYDATPFASPHLTPRRDCSSPHSYCATLRLQRNTTTRTSHHALPRHGKQPIATSNYPRPHHSNARCFWLPHQTHHSFVTIVHHQCMPIRNSQSDTKKIRDTHRPDIKQHPQTAKFTAHLTVDPNLSLCLAAPDRNAKSSDEIPFFTPNTYKTQIT